MKRSLKALSFRGRSFGARSLSSLWLRYYTYLPLGYLSSNGDADYQWLIQFLFHGEGESKVYGDFYTSNFVDCYYGGIGNVLLFGVGLVDWTSSVVYGASGGIIVEGSPVVSWTNDWSFESYCAWHLVGSGHGGFRCYWISDDYGIAYLEGIGLCLGVMFRDRSARRFQSVIFDKMELDSTIKKTRR
jgi:hypothetical protein